jgi:hypothetical protein
MKGWPFRTTRYNALTVVLKLADGSEIELPVHLPEPAFVTSLELRLNDQPVVVMPFAHHGAGLHTLCRLNADGQEMVDPVSY